MTTPEAPDLRLDELKELAEQDDLHPFLLRVRHVHPSDLADILSALEEPTRVRVISELPLGSGANKHHFIARNRIIAALSLGTILVQARSERSGAMITIKRCHDYGRDVLAVPGDVRSELSTGPHQLLREGAAL